MRLSKRLRWQHCNAAQSHNTLCRWMLCRGAKPCLINSSSDRQSHHNWGLETCFKMRLRAITQKKHNLRVIALCRMIWGRIALLTNKKIREQQLSQMLFGRLDLTIDILIPSYRQSRRTQWDASLSHANKSNSSRSDTPSAALHTSSKGRRLREDATAHRAAQPTSRTEHTGIHEESMQQARQLRWLFACQGAALSHREGRTSDWCHNNKETMSEVNDTLLWGMSQRNIANEPAMLQH